VSEARLSAEQQARVASAVPVVARCAAFVASRHASVSRDDLHGVGQLALVRCAASYDASRGEFEAYAYAWIMAEMKSEVRRVAKLRQREWLSPHAAEVHEEERPVDAAEIERFLRSTPAEDAAKEQRAMSRRVAGLAASALVRETAVGGEDDEVERQMYARARQALLAAVERFGEPNRSFFFLYYRDERTLTEIGRELAIPERTLRRLHDRVERELDQALRGEVVG
jgi:RNA polymerase sigma factor (sigma-70 family)